ncbi:MAG: low molecular weight phosphotyrosine protein phosphatase, partial [Erysipelotrichaceae bacterium]|nr:low molecular weight phosphotyrosine protein phosphatase [Erysipelotrichaceae bacterium]
FYIESAATSREEIGNGLYPPAKSCLRAHGVPFGRHSARQVTKRDYDKFDEIYLMDSNNMRNIRRILPSDPEHKIHMMLPDRNIADPWYTDNFEKTYRELTEGCLRILEEADHD